MKSFAGKDILSLKGFSRLDLEQIFVLSKEMEQIISKRSRTDLLKDKILATLFFQASTRTRLSFESAMLRLGGGVLGFADPKMTRSGDFYKESLADTVQMIENYADAMVIRHPEEFAPAQAAETVSIPVINGGDGYNEHPTQGMLDVYTIYRELGTVDGLTITLLGDMNIRVLHSLPFALAQFNTKVNFVSPPDMRLPDKWKKEFDQVGLRYEEKFSLSETLSDTDVYYLVKIFTQSFNVGRADASAEEKQTPSDFVLDCEKLLKAKPGAIVLHPLPRGDELPFQVDPRGSAKYFDQSFYGVAIRMALLSLLLG